MITGTERIFDSLDAEWALVCAEPEHTAWVCEWLFAAGALQAGQVPASLDEVLELMRRQTRAQGKQFSDRWLMALLRVAAGQGAQAQLAARVVVQSMLPMAVVMTRRLLRSGRDFDEVGQTVVACLYQVVRTYPASRVRKVAANVQMETLHLASRELEAEAEPDGLGLPEVVSTSTSASPSASMSAGPEESVWPRLLAAKAAECRLVDVAAEDLEGARGELVELLLQGLATGAVTEDRARAIAQDIRQGGREESQQAGVSAMAWRQRRSRAVRELRAVASDWAVAA
ncbi:hypothetical protein RCO28_34210 [Streptomyces sp. LHD-70]|uniref:hypothetical protein n=1 Tax=Streptomyces sp. LHD-70 TaxID=3072140 RepID=UPI00280FEA04|nr:hypothetical protein [Streptomyces sp. LHD-70]MDQ8707487.1 hypothetical protein [Streptomyces sp. LHD-70]